MKLILIFFILIFHVHSIHSQTPLGGCGSPGLSHLVTNPTCGESIIGPYCFGQRSDVPFAINTLNQGIYLTTQKRRIGATSPCVARIQISLTTRSVNEDGTVFTSINNCGLQYNLDLSVDANNGPETCQQPNVYMYGPYNLCQSVDLTTGGDFFLQYSRSGSDTFYRYSHSYPQPFTTAIATLNTATTLFPSINYQVCGERYYFTAISSSSIKAVGISSGTTWNTNFVTYTDTVILSYNDDLADKIWILYKPSNNSIHIAQMNKTTITYLDAAPNVAGFFPVNTVNNNWFFNTETGYLYSLCNNPPCAIYQIDMVNWNFIRWKTSDFPYDLAYRLIPMGLDNQILAGTSPDLNTLYGYGPILFCIKDPWNPVYLGKSLADTSVDPVIAKTSYPVTNLANSGCFNQNYFLGQMVGGPGTNAGTFMDYCGSGVYNNVSYCNTNQSGIGICCPLECTIDENPCGNATECHDAPVCVAADTCAVINNYNTSVSCGLSPSECIPESFCDGMGNCSQSEYSPNTTSCGINATVCVPESFCDGLGTCIQQPFEPDTTVCENSTMCHGAAYCTGVNQSCGDYVNVTNPGEKCADGSLCVNASYCNDFGECIPDYLSNDTQCGTPVFNHLCLKNNTCSGVSDVCEENFQPEGTICYETVGSVINYGKCDASGMCVFETPIWNISNLNITNLTFIDLNNTNLITNTDYFYFLLFLLLLLLLWFTCCLKTYFLYWFGNGNINKTKK